MPIIAAATATSTRNGSIDAGQTNGELELARHHRIVSSIGRDDGVSKDDAEHDDQTGDEQQARSGRCCRSRHASLFPCNVS